MESENDVVWITLQAHQSKWKRVIIPKFQGDGTYLMSIFYADPNHREKFLNLTLCRTRKKQQHTCQFVFMLTAILGPIFCDEEKRHGSCTEF